MNKTILITDKVHPLLLEGLKGFGFDVSYHPKMSYDDVISIVNKFNGLIINSKVICDQNFLKKFSHLEFIGRLGSGLDIIDLPFAASKGIKIISSPEGNANAVGEHAIGMLLNLLHNLGAAHADVTSNLWNREVHRGTELLGKKVGIIGFGHTGPAFAQKLIGFETEILIYDKYRKNIEEAYPFVSSIALDDVLSNADIVSIHLPLTSETKGWVDDTFIQKIKQGAIIINTSRGLILKSEALLAALERNHLKGACLDVLENERPETWTAKQKMIYGRLLKRKDVMITPHIAGWTFRSLELIAKILLQKICKFYQV